MGNVIKWIKWVFAANEKVIEVLQNKQRLMNAAKITHSYPCCWRHKSKIIFRTTQVPMILGEHATDDAGTGLVHTAPAHGMDDFLVSSKYDLDLHNPVGDDGCYLPSTELFAGLYRDWETDRKSTRLNSSHRSLSRMPSSA